MVTHWSLNDSKSLQVSRTLRSILADFNIAVVWMVSTMSTGLYTYIFFTVPSAPIKIGITVTVKFHRFFITLARSSYLAFFLLSFNFIHWSVGTAHSQFCWFPFFFFFFGWLSLKRAIGLMSRVFANGPEDRGSDQIRVIPKNQKMVLDAALVNTQHYKIRAMGKVEQSME